jgi:hypothetical protein
MMRIWPILVAFLGLVASAAPASADLVFTLNEGGSIAPTPGNYGTVDLQNVGNGAAEYVKVTVTLAAGENFVGTGAGYAITWNIAGNPNLMVAGDESPNSFNPAAPLPAGFSLENSGDKILHTRPLPSAAVKNTQFIATRTAIAGPKFLRWYLMSRRPVA